MKQSSENELLYSQIRDIRRIGDLKLKQCHKALLWAFDSRGKKVFPSLQTIAGDCGSSVPTVMRGIKDLENVGVLTKKRRWNSSNRYELVRPVIMSAFREAEAEMSARRKERGFED